MIQIAYNAVHATIRNADERAMLEVNRVLTYDVQGAENTPSFKARTWDGKASFFRYSTGEFPAGFVDIVSRTLAKIGYKSVLVGSPLPLPLGPERPEVDSFGYVDRYDYQPAAVDALLKHGKTIIRVATGGGKSRIARMAMKRIGRKTLFLTTRSILMHQMREAIVAMGDECAVLGDGYWGIPGKPESEDGYPELTTYNVGMVQTLAQRIERKSVAAEKQALRERIKNDFQKKQAAYAESLKKIRPKLPPVVMGEMLNEHERELREKQPDVDSQTAAIEARVKRHNAMRIKTLETLKEFELLIVEEAHELSGNGFYSVTEACVNAHYRMALTATPFMKGDEEANMRLLAACGPVGMKITEGMLIERGILAKPYFKFAQLPKAEKPKKLYAGTTWARAYQFGIVKNDSRNARIVAEVIRAKRWGLNSMILVQHKAHGKELCDMLNRNGVRAKFIFGDDNQEQRSRSLADLGSRRIDALIGSTILDVGVDVPSVGMIVLAGGGKAEVATRQRIGRGLREKKSGPNIALIVDFEDSYNTHLIEHRMQRRQIIESTPGFAENIVSDFDYAALGFTRG